MMHMILTDYRQRSRQFSFRLLAVFAVFSAVGLIRGLADGNLSGQLANLVWLFVVLLLIALIPINLVEKKLVY